MIKLTKNVPLLFTAWGNIDDLHVAHRLSHVRKTASLTTLRTHTVHVCSTQLFDTHFLSCIIELVIDILDELVSMLTTYCYIHTHIHTYSNFLIRVTSVGLASAHRDGKFLKCMYI